MHKPDIFHTYQAQIAGTLYLAVPRLTGSGKQVDIHVLCHPDVGGVTAAIVSEDGRIIEASRLAAGRHGDEHQQAIDGEELAPPVRNAFQAIAAAVLGRNPRPVPYAAVDFLSIPRKRLEL
jgi:hypothetical protein